MRLFRLVLSLGFLAMAGAGTLGFAVVLAYVDEQSRDLPDYGFLKRYVPKLGSRIVASDGSLLSSRSDQRRTFMPIGKIPPLVVHAFLAAEDRNFFSHSGVDPVAIGRAVASNSGGGARSGGSTIDQQVAKNLLVGNEHSLPRKVREAVLAYRMDRDLGKPRILEIYLNEIYLGQGAYGVAEAAKTYFGKPLDQLLVREAAVIAALPKAPSSFNPVRNPARARERRDYVLRRMYEDGYISKGQEGSDLASQIELVDRKAVAGRDVGQVPQGGWFEDAGWKVAVDSLGQEALSKRDVVVTTTQRPDLQQAAERALRKGILRADQSLGWRGPLARVRLPVDWSSPDLQPPPGADALQVAVVESPGQVASLSLSDGSRAALGAEGVRWTGRGSASFLARGDAVLLDVSGREPRLVQMPEVDGALVVMDPRDGDVVAMAGGFSHDRGVFNRATQARRQPGSSFKPIVYSAALAMGYDATSPLVDAPIALEQGPGLEDWRPSDAKSAGHGGLISVRQALEKSRNMATVRLLWNIGLEDVAENARKLGFSFDNMTYPYALGAGEVSPLQLATAYCAFANGGRLPKPRFVKDVRTREGVPVKSFAGGAGDQVLDPVAAAQMSSILRGVPTRGTAAATFRGFGHPLSGKTGTTNGSRDAWFAGFMGDFVAVVWIGRDDNRPLADGETGGRLAAPVVRDFLEAAGGAIAYVEPPVPEGLVEETVDPATGLPARQGIVEIVRPSSKLLAGEPAEARAGPRRSAKRDRDAPSATPRGPAPAVQDGVVPDEYVQQ